MIRRVLCAMRARWLTVGGLMAQVAHLRAERALLRLKLRSSYADVLHFSQAADDARRAQALAEHERDQLRTLVEALRGAERRRATVAGEGMQR